MTLQIGNGRGGKLLRLRIIYSTGDYILSFPSPSPSLYSAHFSSLGERYGLRIIPGKNSFLVLPNNISRSTAVGAILHPGGPARSPLSGRAAWMSPDAAGEVSGGDDLDFLLAVSGDEKLLRRLNEFDGSETCSTGGKGTDAKWRIEPGNVGDALRVLAGVH
jgi:hypothetical protein